MPAAAAVEVGQHGSLFEKQAKVYAEYRLGYPPHVLAAILEFAALPQKELAVDVACGTGQMAVSLAGAFDAVIAQDSAAGQLEHAAQRPNITYQQAPAEDTGLPARCADLVTAAQSMHWFDVPRFYAEARRILKPTGCLAVFGYIPLAIHFPGNERASSVLKAVLLDSNPYFHEQRQRFVHRLYSGLEPTADDFGVVKTRVVGMQREQSVEQIVGWLRSMSGWASYEAEHPGASEQLQAGLLAALGVPDASTPVEMLWPLTMVLAKQPRPPAGHG